MTNGKTFEKSFPGTVWCNLKNEPSLKSIVKSFINKKRGSSDLSEGEPGASFTFLTALTLKLDLIFFHRPWLKESQHLGSIWSQPADDDAAHLSVPSHCHLIEAEIFLFGASIGVRETNELCWQTESQFTASVNQCQPVTKPILAEFATAAAVRLLEGHCKFLTCWSSASSWWVFECLSDSSSAS